MIETQVKLYPFTSTVCSDSQSIVVDSWIFAGLVIQTFLAIDLAVRFASSSVVQCSDDGSSC